MLIPFPSEGGTWWMNSSHSESVITDTKQVADSFTFAAKQGKLIDEQSGPLRWKGIREAGSVLVGWLVFLGLGTLVVGWIVRGFFGIPAGMDFKPEKAKSEPVVEDA